MKTARILLAVVSLLVLAAFPARVFADSAADDSNSQVILVKFKPGIAPAEAMQVHRQHGGRVQGVIPGIGVQQVAVPAGKGLEKARGYAASPAVAYAEPDGQYQAVATPDDTYFSQQWGLEKVGASQAWDVTTGSGMVNIAILDTGIDPNHPDLAGKVIDSVNFSSSPTVADIYGHGTHVAGIAAAGTNNGLGVAGLGYDSTLMNVKVLNDSGSGYYSWIASGIVWAADNGAEVINLSLGGTSSSLALEDAVAYAWNKGVVVVAAAGNSGTSVPFYPAAFTECIAVAATDSSDAKASWSNYGDWVDVAAPGVGIYATLINSSYGYKSGTSMASPFVAGLAALVLTTTGDTNSDGRLNDEVRTGIETGCDDIGVAGIGAGRINAAASVGSEPVVPGNITGYVTDNADGSPISGATVSDGSHTATTDVSGAYLLTGIIPGSRTVTAANNGYESATAVVTVVAGETVAADFSLEKIIIPGGIVGYVTDTSNGAAIVGATVNCDGDVATTDATGRYEFDNLLPQTYTLTVTADGYQTATRSVAVTSGITYVINFALEPDEPSVITGTITGTVTGAAAGTPLEGVIVSAGTQTALTDAAGTYTINDILPGSYEVTAAKDGYESATQTVAVYAGVTTVADFSLAADAPPPTESPMWVDSISFSQRGKNLFISVSVSDESGAVAGASVSLSLECSTGETWNFSGTTDTSGAVTFKIGKAPAGEYLAAVTGLNCSGFTWDSTRGITSAGYTLP